MSSFATGSIETRVNSYTTSADYSPSVTALADGGWVTTWYSNRTDDPGGYDIYQQHYSATGHTVGSQVRVNSFTTDTQLSSEVTALDDGGWVVTWYGAGAPNGSGIYQQRFAANGHRSGAETIVNTYTGNTQNVPEIAALSDGGWVVTWYGGGIYDTYGVYQQRYGAGGRKLGTETQVNTYTANVQMVPVITGLSDGGWVVSWEGQGYSDNGYYNIYQQRYSAGGDAIGGEMQVNSYTTYSQLYPAVTGLADGGWVVTWYGAGATDGNGIYEKRYAANGEVIADDMIVNAATTDLQLTPAVAALADGGWVVTWQSSGEDGSGYGIFQQRYAGDGATIGGDTRVNAYTTNDQSYVSVTGLSDGGWIVTWQGEGATDSQGIFQRHFAPDVIGTMQAEKLGGTRWDETLLGYGGQDRLNGKGGNDLLVGGFGNDTYVVNSIGDDVQEQAVQGTDTVLASISYTLGAAVENLVLTGKAKLDGAGNSGDNRLTGNGAANILQGDGGADILTGSKGNDILYGGAGADRFVFAKGDGKDAIRDFDAKGADHDIVDLSHVGAIRNYSDLTHHHMEQHGSSVVINGDHGDTITLTGIRTGQLAAADFHF